MLFRSTSGLRELFPQMPEPNGFAPPLAAREENGACSARQITNYAAIFCFISLSSSFLHSFLPPVLPFSANLAFLSPFPYSIRFVFPIHTVICKIFSLFPFCSPFLFPILYIVWLIIISLLLFCCQPIICSFYYCFAIPDRKSTRLNSSHEGRPRMLSSA